MNKIELQGQEIQLKQTTGANNLFYFHLPIETIFTFLDIKLIEKQGYKFIGIDNIPTVNVMLVSIEKIPFM